MSKQGIPLLTLALTLTAAISACRFVNATGVQAGADENTFGVARSAGAIADKVPVDVIGVSVVEAGAAIAAGATVKSDATGRAITWAVSGAKVAVAMEAATAAGQFIEVRLIDNAT